MIILLILVGVLCNDSGDDASPDEWKKESIGKNMLAHYKSWNGLKKQLEASLCDSLKGRVAYFFTRYHKVHNSYGRAAVNVDGREIVCFSWIEMCNQEYESGWLSDEEQIPFREAEERLKADWDHNCTYCETDFLIAALQFRNLPIQEALESENYIIKIFAVLDKRVGKRTLEQLKATGAYLTYPEWVKQFYQLRFSTL